MFHNKYFNKCSIFNTFCDQMNYFISITIFLYFYCINIFQCKIQGVHYTRSPIEWSKFWFYEYTCYLTYYCIINNNLYHSFWSNLHQIQVVERFFFIELSIFNVTPLFNLLNSTSFYIVTFGQILTPSPMIFNIWALTRV